LRHEHAAIDLQADGFAKFNPAAGFIGAVAINHFAAHGHVGKRRAGGDQKY
jgi:hypothetical protein